MRAIFSKSLLSFLLLCHAAVAQDKMSDGVQAAVAAAGGYLQSIASKEWEAAGRLVKASALKRQHQDYVMMARRARTIDEEVKLVQRMGVERLRDIEAMTPLQFYVASRIAAENANMLTPAVKERMKETFAAEFIGALAEPERKLVHVLNRTRHETLDTVITELIFLTMEVDAEGNWVVAPEHQQMSIRPLVSGELPEGLLERLKGRPAKGGAAPEGSAGG